jgi:hypothetical protein
VQLLRLLLAPLLFLLTLCCGPARYPDGASGTKPATIHWHVDTDFTAEERANLKFAVDAWKDQTQGLALMTLTYDLDFESVQSLQAHEHDYLIIKGEGTRICDEPGLLGMAPPWGGIHSPTKEPTRLILCTASFDSPNTWRQVAIHEMGHSLGLSHVPSPQALMYPNLIRGRSACLKQPDLSEFCRVNDCRGKALHGCE